MSEFILSFLSGCSETMTAKEIAKKVGRSEHSVKYALYDLLNRELVQIEPGRRRPFYYSARKNAATFNLT